MPCSNARAHTHTAAVAALQVTYSVLQVLNLAAYAAKVELKLAEGCFHLAKNVIATLNTWDENRPHVHHSACCAAWSVSQHRGKRGTVPIHPSQRGSSVCVRACVHAPMFCVEATANSKPSQVCAVCSALWLHPVQGGSGESCIPCRPNHGPNQCALRTTHLDALVELRHLDTFLHVIPDRVFLHLPQQCLHLRL